MKSNKKNVILNNSEQNYEYSVKLINLCKEVFEDLDGFSHKFSESGVPVEIINKEKQKILDGIETIFKDSESELTCNK